MISPIRNPEHSSSSPQPLPSLPSSPFEEDLSRPSSWTANGPPRNEPDLSVNESTKGKARGNSWSHENGDSYDISGEEEQDSEGVEGYPPMTDEEAESRRIEETLRRWETAERERRRAARSSIQATSSAVGDVVRRASGLWSKRSSRAPKDGSGTHTFLNSRTSEDGVPLDTIDGSPSISAANSPTPSVQDFSSETENPFANTPLQPISPFDDVHQASAIMHESLSIPPTPAASGSQDKAPIWKVPPDPSSLKPPPPKPLNLPEPRTPPPRTGTPAANSAPEPISPPVIAPVKHEEQPEVTRWWTDWLCGCTEGPDRGGQDQAGRTNPME